MRRLLPASRSWYVLVVSAVLAACGGDGPTDPGGGGGGGGGANTPAAVVRANDHTNGQSALAGTAVANAPAVRVTNSAGAAVANVAVTFAVTAGGGTLGATTATTNAQGIASAGSWTLGATPGANTVRATVGSLTPVEFTATGTAAAPVTLVASRVDVGGRAFKCAVRASNVVSCWGENPAGNLGDGTTTFRQFPVNLAIDGVAFASTALGTLHGCALTTAGAAYCWGRNNGGMVGDGSTTDRPAPVAVSGNHTFKALAAGPTYTCGIKSDDTLWCWGTQNGGTLASQSLVPKQLAGGSAITSLSVTLEQVCGAVATGGVKCWTGNIFAAAAPAVASSGLTFTALAGGNRHQCGLVADGRAYCWGFNAAGQLATNDINDRAAPTLVVGPFRYASIDAGANHTCALGTDNVAYCWGNNVSGQLGVNVLPTTEPARAFPSAVVAPQGVQFQRVAAGGNASCGIATDSKVYCWGARAINNAGTVVDGLIVPTEVRDQ